MDKQNIEYRALFLTICNLLIDKGITTEQEILELKQKNMEDIEKIEKDRMINGFKDFMNVIFNNKENK